MLVELRVGDVVVNTGEMYVEDYDIDIHCYKLRYNTMDILYRNSCLYYPANSKLFGNIPFPTKQFKMPTSKAFAAGKGRDEIYDPTIADDFETTGKISWYLADIEQLDRFEWDDIPPTSFTTTAETVKVAHTSAYSNDKLKTYLPVHSVKGRVLDIYKINEQTGEINTFKWLEYDDSIIESLYYMTLDIDETVYPKAITSFFTPLF